MTDHDDNNEIFEIDFEVGHVSILRSEVTTTHNPPRTHDWKIFLRSANLNGDLTCLIRRCIFHLHPEYPNSKRELTTSPYAIQETGYAGFHLPIDIYFKTKNEPKKFRIEYDLDLHRNIDGHPYRQKESYLRKYRCTLYNPDEEFREKILAAGGKIVDSGPISSNNTKLDENELDNELITRQSPQQKRPASPALNQNGNKKLKVEQTITNTIKKKSVQSVTNKTIVNTKKTKLIPHKSSSLLEEKVSKTSVNKEPNETVDIMNKKKTLDVFLNDSNRLDSSAAKPRPTTKLVKSQSTTNINGSTNINIKMKESIPSPSKVKLVTNSQTIPKKTINKKPLKTSLKPELTLNTIVKSPLNLNLKQESSPQPPSIPISNLRKIPKKPVVSKVDEKRSHSLKPSSSSNRHSIQDSKKTQILTTSKTKSTVKRDHSLSSSSVNTTNNDLPKKTKPVKDPSIASRIKQSKAQISSPPKSTRTSPQSQLDSAINSTASSSIEPSQSSTFSSPSTQIFSNEDNHIETPMDIVGENHDDQIQLSEKSNSPLEPTKTSSTRLSCSDESDSNDSELSLDNEQDLPSILTNDDLRYKLIYIYKRFQLNSINDLIIFVRFFKRHQLIDPNSLLMTKSTNDMITYDLFLLNPSQIIELANDLGYTTTNLVNSIE